VQLVCKSRASANVVRGTDVRGIRPFYQDVGVLFWALRVPMKNAADFAVYNDSIISAFNARFTSHDSQISWNRGHPSPALGPRPPLYSVERGGSPPLLLMKARAARRVKSIHD